MQANTGIALIIIFALLGFFVLVVAGLKVVEYWAWRMRVAKQAIDFEAGLEERSAEAEGEAAAATAAAPLVVPPEAAPTEKTRPVSPD